MSDLTEKRCLPCEGGVAPLTEAEAKKLLADLSGWQLSNDCKWLSIDLKFKDFHETMAFINKVADIANEENHHPDISLGYNYCTIKFQTHAIDGLSENDFICAAKIDQVK